MPNYKKSKIYKIIDNTNNNVYVGSTTRTLNERLTSHRDKYKKYINGEVRFASSYDIIKNNDYKIILIENYPCNNIDELHQREQHYIDNIKCINIHRAYLSKENRKEQLKQNRLDKLQYRRNKDKKRYENLKLWGDSYNNLLYIDINLFA
jgi:hypothetical protein